mmetsp:Transcript_39835/g.95284  ORF Transcript_39835/g.95284 Transcript_39835/m.95284 type:complete len:203 (-) Transcript_39835:268-876(-)
MLAISSLQKLHAVVVGGSLQRLRPWQTAPTKGPAGAEADEGEGREEAEAAARKRHHGRDALPGKQLLVPDAQLLKLRQQLLRSRRGLLREREVAPPAPPALTALRGAGAPLLPRRPRAEGLGAAAPRAAAELLVRRRLAVLAPLLRVLHNVPEALPLAVALGASAPLLPVAVSAVLGVPCTQVPAALGDLAQRVNAGLASMG